MPGILPEGATLLCGAPKAGKSWLALSLALSVTSGRKALGSVDVEAGPALYLALEDTARRLQRRLRQLLAADPAPAGLTLAIDCPALPDGGLNQIEKWLQLHAEPRMVIIDVFERVRGPQPPNVSAYAADYAAVRSVKQLADAYGVALVLVHHVRKVANDDFLSEISGTLGLPGAADTIIVLKRKRGENDGALHVTGRDVEEQEYALQFDPARGAWSLLGLAAEHGLGETRAQIAAWVRTNAPDGTGPTRIATGTGLPHDRVRKTVLRMAEAGQLVKDERGLYSVPHAAAAPGVV